MLDGDCGTGRLAIELARRGVAVLGVDRDPDMIAAARANAPRLEWVEADLAELAPAGRLIAGFQRRSGWPTPEEYDGWCAAAGLLLEDRFATRDRARYQGAATRCRSTAARNDRRAARRDQPARAATAASRAQRISSTGPGRPVIS